MKTMKPHNRDEDDGDDDWFLARAGGSRATGSRRARAGPTARRGPEFPAGLQKRRRTGFAAVAPVRQPLAPQLLQPQLNTSLQIW